MEEIPPHGLSSFLPHWPLTMIYSNLRVISDVFMERSQEKNIVEEIELIMGVCAKRNSP